MLLGSPAGFDATVVVGMQKSVWLSFDLGVQGDYEGLYRWLDSLDARECGDNLAYFFFEPKEDLLAEIKAGVEKAINIDKKTRIYVIFLNQDGKAKGRFLFGHRKAPAWAGFAVKETVDDDEYGR